MHKRNYFYKKNACCTVENRLSLNLLLKQISLQQEYLDKYRN
jgi:hypothetical protein